MQTSLLFSEDMMTSQMTVGTKTNLTDEIVAWFKAECQRTQRRIPRLKAMAHFSIGNNKSDFVRALSLLKAEGWTTNSGRNGGYGPPEFGKNNPKGVSSTKAIVKQVKLAPARIEPEFSPTEEELIEQVHLHKDMYFNHVKGLFDDIRSSLSDSRLSDFHPEIEEFLSHTKQHLIGVINKL